MSTAIDALLDAECVSDGSDVDHDNYDTIIMSLNLPLDKRIGALEDYYAQEDVGDNAIEVLSALSGMYQMSGSKLIEQFLYRICTHAQVSAFLKLEAAKNLLEYEEEEEDSDDEDETILERNKSVKKNNMDRKVLGYKALDYACYDLDNLSTPCRTQAILLLMDSEDHQTNADAYFREFVRDDKIECDFRYKAILALENVGAEMMRDDFREEFKDTEFVEHFYNSLKTAITRLFPKSKPNPKNLKFWHDVLRHLPYDELHDMYREKYPDKPCGRDFFVHKAQLAFLFHQPNQTYYRTLAGQYLLQKCILTETRRFQVEEQILKFARDEELDYNRRADAADVLLQLGSLSMKQHGRNIIMELGRVDGVNRTVFDNAQNVHTEDVEESVAEVLGLLSALPLLKIGKQPIDFSYVSTQVEDMLKEDRECLCVTGVGDETCDHCGSPIEEKVEEGGKKFCSNECLRFHFRDEKIRLALNRIFMDRALYSKFNSSLINILLKIWTYLIGNDNEQEMRKRLLEELEEMCGTCSSGFATRLVNVISGFGEFNIRISFEDQIVANFSGRLNAAARHIADADSIFRKTKLNDVVELWLNRKENAATRQAIEDKLNPSGKLEKRPTSKDVVKEYLSTDREEKVEECIEDFSEAVLNELTIASSSYAARQNFALFFRSYVSIIREELHGEFKDLVDDATYDLAFRRSIMSYEGEG